MRQVVARGFRTGLIHQPFVDHYYSGQEWSRLYLSVSMAGTVEGALGVERLRFEYESREISAAVGTNFFSLRPGAGEQLYQRWLDAAPACLAFWGGEGFFRWLDRKQEEHESYRSQKWTFFPGINLLALNYSYPRMHNDPKWRSVARDVVRNVATWSYRPLAAYADRIPKDARRGIVVTEESGFRNDLIPTRSTIAFRLVQSPEYLRWRYATGLSYVRYRLFRILRGVSPVGFVVLRELPDRFVVAHCDGEDPEGLAFGILLSLIKAAESDEHPREVLLASSHHLMQGIFRKFGFRRLPSDQIFAIGSSQRPVELPLDTSNWLVNFGWGDNGLRPPFLDQVETRE